VSRYQKGKTKLDFTEARDSEWQWHQLGRMQVCTLLQTNNHASTPPLRFLHAGCPFLLPNQQRQSAEGISTFIKSVIMCRSLSQKWESFSAKPRVKVDGCRYLLSVNGRCFQMLWLARQPISALYAQHSSTAAV